jgi:hypothetical protein
MNATDFHHNKNGKNYANKIKWFFQNTLAII